MKISVSLDGVQALRSKIAAFHERLSDLRPALARGAVEVLDAAQTQFNEQGDPPWAPKKRPNGMPLLVRTGSLKESLQAGAQESAVTFPGGILVGTNIAYAPVQQYGSDHAGRGGNTVIPARPFLWRDPEELGHKIQAVFAAYIAGKAV